MIGRTIVGGALTSGLLLASAASASAHIAIAEKEQQPDSYAVLSFGVPHGCDGSPTTRIRIQLPESIPTATPTVNPGWDIDLVTQKLDKPIDLGEGRSLTERITEVDYTAKSPLPANYRDVLALSVHIPEDAAGKTLYFPTIQECEKGQGDWTMIPQAGQDADELDTPAPSIVVAKASGESAMDGQGTTSTGSGRNTASEEPSDSSGANWVSVAALVAAIVGIVLGGAALASARKRSS
ncbi:MAG: YcnI family protein [Microthrixaceae bacterium]